MKNQRRNDQRKLDRLKEERADATSLQKKLLWIPITGWIMAGAIEIIKEIENYEEKIEDLENDIDRWQSKISKIKGNKSFILSLCL